MKFRTLLVALALAAGMAAPAHAQVFDVIAPSPNQLTNPVITGQAKFPDGTALAPSRTYTADLDLGSYRIGANNEGFTAGGVLRWDYNDSRIYSTLPVAIGTLDTSTYALVIQRGSTGGNSFVRFNRTSGTGAVLDLLIAGVSKFSVNDDGSGVTTTFPLFFSPDSTHDIGASGATRPRDGFFGRKLRVAGVGSAFGSNADLNGDVLAVKSTGAGFGLSVIRSTNSEAIFTMRQDTGGGGLASVRNNSSAIVIELKGDTGAIKAGSVVSPLVTVTTDATAGARTYTAAELIGGIILRNTNGANRSDVTPTAAAIVAALPSAAVGQAFEFTIRNTATAAETITVTAGSGVTLSGTMTIAQNNTKRFLVVCTNVGAGTEAVTIYSLGTIVH